MTLVPGCAIVTGGGSGIGRAIAEALAHEGAAVGVVDLLPEGGLHTVEAITDAGARAEFARADVSQWTDVDAVIGKLIASLGPLGILVNAAGILDGYAPVHELSPAVWTKVIAINLSGTFFACKRALEEMVPAGRGRIINLASVAGLIGDGGGPAYVASKHGVVGLTRQLAVNAAARGITVNAICPGPIQTGLRANSTTILGAEAPVMRGIGGDEAAIKAVTPAGRRGTVEEIAATARFLASEEAGYITGHTLVIDGGWTAR
ncbi:MAG TPA: SDR family NAD(P)-dependent oxidoreductase [Methylomirabilota bacterium]|jgi:NAD(P)-dependent dehydrogenase (short-subunit alcohol dehydrogenase family)|nr:SDR family NAD(P)-dependent oxidoreductase [Methylomirabilota bacterium]